MLAVIFALSFWAAPLDAEFGDNFMAGKMEDLCVSTFDGKWDANARVNTVGKNKEYRDAPSHVPYCTRGPIDLLIEEVGPLVDKL